MQSMFGRSFASSVVNSALATLIFDLAFVRKRTSVSFVAGQPLGYYSSWPLFALSHHKVVWIAAEHVYPGSVFKNYAVPRSGDDVVIADPVVKAFYIQLLTDPRSGVSISVGKSLH